MKNFKQLAVCLLVVSFLLATNVFAQDEDDIEHFEPIEDTGSSMTVLLGEMVFVAEDQEDEPLAEGDEVAIFTEAGLCVGAKRIVDPDRRLGVAAWADDPFTEDDIDGFTVDEPMFFRVWDRDDGEEGTEWNAEVIDVEEGFPPYDPVDAIFVIEGFITCNLICGRVIVPDIEVDPESYDFGNIGQDLIGEFNLVIGNIGNGDLTISGIAVEGNVFSTDFGDQEVIIAPDDDPHTVVVTFDHGNQGGEYEGSLTISSDDPDEAEFVVPLQGLHVPPSPRIELNLEEPYEYDFGSVVVHQYRDWNNLYISNVGEEELILEEIIIDDGAFSTLLDEDLAGEGVIVIAPAGEEGDRIMCVITFAPEEAGEDDEGNPIDSIYTAEMVISSNATNFEAGEVIVSLTGIAVPEGGPVIIIGEEGEDDDHLFFGRAITDEAASRRLLISNGGGEDLIIESIVSTNEVFDTDFIEDVMANRLRPGDHRYLNIFFTPVEEALYEGELHIVSNDPNVDEHTIVYLIGEGIEESDMHFLYYETGGLTHLLLVEEATLNGEPLLPGDEIGVFTPRGLCAGAGVVPEGEDRRTGFSAWMNDPDLMEDDHIINGFLVDEEFTFRVWDAGADVEAPAVPEYLFEEEPTVFTPHGATRLNLAAETQPPPPEIFVSDFDHYYGQVDIDGEDGQGEPDEVDWTFYIQNRGLGDLTISSISSDLNVFTVNYDGIGDDLVLEDGQQRIITVTFIQVDTLEYVGRITIESDDPNDPVLSVDVTGDGVTEVVQPRIELAVDNIFFGVQHIEEGRYPWELGPFEFGLEIFNVGGGELRVENVTYEGDERLNVDFENEFGIEEEQSAFLTFSFDPDQERVYGGTFTITSTDILEAEVEFLVEGVGAISDDYFLHRETETSMLINIERAFEHLQDDENEALLGVDDEIAVFTPAGLCVGHVVLGEGGNIPDLLAWADDPDSEVLDGFVDGEEMSFRIWDVTRWEVLPVTGITIVEGDQTFNPNGETTVILAILIDEHERQVGAYFVDGDNIWDNWDFGPIVAPVYDDEDNLIREGESVQATLTVTNTQGQTLIVTDIEPNNEVLSTDFDGEERQLASGESFEVVITFEPATGFAYADIGVIIHSNDPDEPDFLVFATGMGSVSLTHYQWCRGEIQVSQSSLITLRMGGEDILAARGDEVGVFTPNIMDEDVLLREGICAGSKVVDDPNVRLGVTAWGDAGGTRFLLEGFKTRDPIEFRVWDASREREYSGEEIIIMDVDNNVIDELLWVVRGLDMITITVPGVPGFIPIGNLEIDETQALEFVRQTVNFDEGMMFEFTGSEPAIPEDNEVTFNEETGEFSWQIGYNAVILENPDDPAFQDYELSFFTYHPDDPDNEDIQDRDMIVVTVYNVNQPPEIDTDILEQDEAWTLDQDVWIYSVDEDAGDVLVLDLAAFFVDGDVDEMQFFYEQPDPNNIGQDIRRPDEDDPNTYWIAVPRTVDLEHWNQMAEEEPIDIACMLRADDGYPEEEERDLTVRTLRSVGNNAMPRRDVTFEFNFLVRVLPVNDAPEIWDTDNDVPYEDDVAITVEVDENVELVFILTAQDVDIDREGDALTWEMTANGGLEGPDEEDWAWDFTDNQDRTATFTWTPGYLVVVGEAQHMFNPTFQVRDASDATDDIVVEITVNDENRLPEVVDEGIPDMEVLEDSQREDEGNSIDLDNYFTDPDGDPLAYRVTESLAEMGALIVGNILSFQPRLDWHGSDNVAVQASDGRGTASGDFVLTVRSLNDPPLPFNQLTPENHYVVPFEEDMILFSWEPSEQNQYEEDAVHYNIIIRYFIDDVADTTSLSGIEGTELSISINDVMDSLGYERDYAGLYGFPDGYEFRTIWWVVAEDDSGATVIAANAAFILNVVMSVYDEYGLGVPTEYFLAPNFPNPFNARTTVRFGLPAPGNAEVTVWDMHGRQVALLATGRYDAGQYKAIWNAEDVTSGVYIIKLVSGKHRIMQKAILIK
ncbi:choice-of-anchor D domain-containing protein [bacterium]|nr:choice-of-anchor D domain-containing protein [bacterium]